MMQFSAAAFTVAFAAVLTASLAADRPRHRSGPIRSVPVGADIKRDKNFDCPEEFGYYPHPTDCSLYYVCVFGGALLESCTGGLMYSHELQTCDWPRNVGCDATNLGAERAVDIEREIEVERLNERELPPPPRRAPPPPPPRAQPNPVVTSRGQPKYNREEYVKQQLYEEVDDLPPVEEIESDRQQRVYRGQPSTIGQVQRDRDGYSQTNSARNFNSNIIPASIPQGNGKIGSFSFGTQVDDRRAATVTQTPQTYSLKINDVTDELHDLHSDTLTNEILDYDIKNVKVVSSRRKREAINESTYNNDTIPNNDTLSDRSDLYDDNDSIVESYYDEDGLDVTERGKRQIRHRYYIKNGFKNNGGKNWVNIKPEKLYEHSHYNINPVQNYQNTRKPTYNSISFPDISSKPAGNLFTTSNPYLQYTTTSNLYNSEQNRPFKASLPDLFNVRPPHNPINTATHIITKSPPISSLTNKENPFSALSGGFFNNNPQQSNNKFSLIRHNENHHDSSHLPSSLVTDKPVLIPSSQRVKPNFNTFTPTKPTDVRPGQYNDNDDDERDEGSDLSSEENDSGDVDFRPHFKPPYEFSHPSNKYAEISNPFAHPNFDFDAFITKLRDEHISLSSSPESNNYKQYTSTTERPSNIESTQSKPFKSTTLTYKGMSTPKPFTLPNKNVNSWTPSSHYEHTPTTISPNVTQYQSVVQRPIQPEKHKQALQLQQQTLNIFNNAPQLSAISQHEASRPKLKPPNFNDDRQLPINHNFKGNFGDQPNVRIIQKKPNYSNVLVSTVTPKTYLYVAGKPYLLSTPKPQFGSPQKTVTLQGQIVTSRPHLSSANPHNANIMFTHTTSKPILITQQSPNKLQQYRVQQIQTTTLSPNKDSEIPSLESMFVQALKPVSVPSNNVSTTSKAVLQTNLHETVRNMSKFRRRPIPKPSPEMNDYYYDDDEEQYYYEPAVKPKYMPSSEVRPQRPPIAQNYEEYEDDSYEDEDEPTSYKPQSSVKRPAGYNTYQVDSATKNYNDVSVVTKPPYKNIKNNINGKIPVPVIMDNVTPPSMVLIRPEVSNYQIVHPQRNRTIHLRKPIKRPVQSGPNTVRPPKYLNQTTLRPYTVRHRLAKPTTVRMPITTNTNNKQINGRFRNPSTMTRYKSTTPSDNHNQETRFSKTKHDEKTNSLEPTESVTPVSYNSPRPKMLYNGSQAYNPDQFDPYYVYDEDGELYKDTDYVQQFNSASLRPAVQQTYRGTPPPARRPVETYTARPVSVDDYDDALIKGQINPQNHYQTPIRTSPRDEGNELGYDHNPSSVRTTLYEATSISTTPSTTTSTSTTTTTTTTTTQRPTTAQYTEAMNPSRYTQRSSTDESQTPIPLTYPSPEEPSVSNSPTDSFVNFSSLAKPFERTNNSLRFRQTVVRTDLSERPKTLLENNKHIVNNDSVARNIDKKIVSLTTGFSIRRNTDSNDNNPYTLTLISRPIDKFNTSDKIDTVTQEPNLIKTFYEISTENSHNIPTNKGVQINSLRRKDSSEEYTSVERDSYNTYENLNTNSKENSQLLKKISSTSRSTLSPKYYLKVIKRPAPFSTNDENYQGSTENSIETDVLIEKALQNVRRKDSSEVSQNERQSIANAHKNEKHWIEPSVSPYTSLNNIRNRYGVKYDTSNDFTTSISTSTYVPTTIRSEIITTELPKQEHSTQNSKYINYKFNEDDNTEPEVFTNKAKEILRAFFKNFENNLSKPQKSNILFSSTPSSFTTEKTVNIGFHKKFHSYDLPKYPNKNSKRVEIITEEAPVRITLSPLLSDSEGLTTTSTTTTASLYNNNEQTTTFERQEKYEENRSKKFDNFLQTTAKDDNNYSTNNKIEFEPTKLINIDNNTTSVDQDRNREINDLNEPTKSTILKTVSKSTKGYIPFPTRTSRVNPAIKLAATNLGGGRRSYQSSNKCSSDDSLQANPKCNEIKYQRPTSTRGRGHAHYSTQGGGEQPQPPQTANRGTPPTRTRPTLKPSTSIVTQDRAAYSKDIYENPPSRPAPVYPQPTPDKTAAKCRKDVCLLPDCYCGGKDIPGDMPVESVPQIVLLTFDDSVNDLNKGLYSDLFEKGRVNPNGCPISATFYVSHEWTDYSQVQNLYSAGHEMASHTISHSFGEQFSQKKWNKEVGGQREILSAYGGVKLEDVRGMRAPFLSVGGNKMFKMLYDSNFTYDSSMPVYENRPPSWPYTLDYKLFHDCMIPPCPTRSYPGVWEVPMVMWQDLNGGRCSMGDACANPPEAEGVYKMLLKNFDRHYTTNRAPFGLFYHAAWFTQAHHKEGFIMFLDFINQMQDVWIVTNWQALQWVRDPTPISRLNSFQPFQCNYQDRPKKCNNPKVCNLWHKSGVRYMRTCQPCPEIYPWTGKTGIRSSRIDNEIEE